MSLPKAKRGNTERYVIDQIGKFSLVFNDKKKISLWLDNGGGNILIGTYKHFGSARAKMVKEARHRLRNKILLLSAELYSCTESYERIY
jgi:hypothetical protein